MMMMMMMRMPHDHEHAFTSTVTIHNRVDKASYLSNHDRPDLPISTLCIELMKVFANHDPQILTESVENAREHKNHTCLQLIDFGTVYRCISYV